MDLRIRPYKPSDYERVLAICIAAFAPIHAGFEETLGSEIFAHQYHDWREQYANTLQKVSAGDPKTKVYVVEDGDGVVAFFFTIMDHERKIGEIGLNAVDPARQGEGIGKRMYEFALDELKKQGAEIAYAGTGGDEAHAPARAAYRAAGFDKKIPSMHLFRKL